MKTPFERMVSAVKAAGYTDLKEVTTESGAHGFMYEDNEVVFYIGEPTGQEWYWKLDGKIAADNKEAFNKWSQVPFYVWLPETDEEAVRILWAIKYLSTNSGFELSNSFGECMADFDFATPENK